MVNPINVKELFAPLGERLYKFESNYFSTFHFYAHHGWEDFDDETPDIYQIAKGGSLFEPQEIYDEAKLHEKRVVDIMHGLKPLECIKIIDELKHVEEIKVPKAFSKYLLQKWKEEFLNYQAHLQTIQKLALLRIEAMPVKAKDNEKTPIPVNEINLPENFTVKFLTKTFNASVSPSQSALFLYYLKEKNLIPKYSDLSMGKLAEALFGRNQKNVTTNFTRIFEVRRSKKELFEFKDILLSLINEVDEDLKEAR